MKSQYCDVTKAGQEVLKAIGDEKTWKAIECENQEFKRGAIWGMAWAMNNIWAYTTKLHMPEQLQKNCGESSIDHASLGVLDRLAERQ